DKYDSMDPIVTERVSLLSTQAFLDRNAALRNAIAAAPEKATALHDALEQRAMELTRAISRGRGDMAALSQEFGFVTKGMIILRHVLGMDENA
ncbi:hypothetical protein, partial [Mailhella sp.]|uniref:hypothetical protein n=1 Tax=Mailhella sp. TaxID=1981029 RepID=UPI004063F39E